MKVKFRKYHSCGNDFVVLKKCDLKKEGVQEICDRHRGIGADGIIMICNSPLEMQIYNQDGSKAMMCGNGLRCFMQACYDLKLVSMCAMVKTQRDLIAVKVLEQKPFNVAYSLPCKTRADWIEVAGTKHIVLFQDYDEEEAKRLTAQWDANVDFVSIINENKIQVSTYERGVGKTEACGTGSCASAYAANRAGFCSSIVSIDFKEEVVLCVISEYEVWTAGISHFIYEGEINIVDGRID